MERIKKIILKIETKWKNSLIRKNLQLKEKIKKLEEDKLNLIKDKQELYDLINNLQANYRDLDIKQRKMKDLLSKSKLFNDLVEVLKNEWRNRTIIR